MTTRAGDAQRFRGLKNGSDRFERLTWVGFTSDATDRTVFYIDNLELVNES